MSMRKLLIAVAMISVLVLGGATLAMAYPNHTSLAWVNPNLDATGLHGVAQYHIEVTDANQFFIDNNLGINEVVIEFESDVFAQFLDASNNLVPFVVVSSAPAGWTWTVDPGTSSSTFSFGTTGTPLGIGESVDVWIEYQLQDYLPNLEGLWNEDNTWHQAVTTWEFEFNGTKGSHGTSTMPVPEPATALLFSSGIALLGYIRRRD